MSDKQPIIPPRPTAITDDSQIAESLLRDLAALSGYLRQRGQQTYETAQRFAENARRHPDTRAYDERQVTMLEYQHHVWQEIAGLVDRLVGHYAETAEEATEEAE